MGGADCTLHCAMCNTYWAPPFCSYAASRGLGSQSMVGTKKGGVALVFCPAVPPMFRIGWTNLSMNWFVHGYSQNWPNPPGIWGGLSNSAPWTLVLHSFHNVILSPFQAREEEEVDQRMHMGRQEWVPPTHTNLLPEATSSVCFMVGPALVTAHSGQWTSSPLAKATVSWQRRLLASAGCITVRGFHMDIIDHTGSSLFFQWVQGGAHRWRSPLLLASNHPLRW